MASKAKLNFYKDSKCTIEADFKFGKIRAGDAASIIVYAKNEGPTRLEDMVVTISIPEIEIDEKKKTFEPGDIWKMTFTWKPKIDMPENKDLQASMRILGDSAEV